MRYSKLGMALLFLYERVDGVRDEEVHHMNVAPVPLHAKARDRQYIAQLGQ
jgi:hypothetical protein